MPDHNLARYPPYKAPRLTDSKRLDHHRHPKTAILGGSWAAVPYQFADNDAQMTFELK